MRDNRLSEFGAEFFAKYPRCFPVRKMLLDRWRPYRIDRFLLRRRLRFLRRVFLWILSLANRMFPVVRFTRTPICGANVGSGWWPILHELFECIERLDLPDGFRIDQVKEKFGELVVRASVHDDAAEKLIDEATLGSRSTCEYCGAPGTLRGRFWVKTLCENCEKERDR